MRLSSAPRDWLLPLLAIAVIAMTLPGYLATSLGGDFISDDARQQVWTLRALTGQLPFAPDIFTRYMLDETMPWPFVQVVAALSRLAGGPEPVFQWLGVISLLACGAFAWLAGRAAGGVRVAWAAAALVFAIDVVATRTAGGLPRAVGMALVFAAAFGFVGRRPIVTAVASVLGGAFWYPAGLMAGALVALQGLTPQGWFGGVSSRPWPARAAIVAAIGVLTLLPIGIDRATPSPWGALIGARDAAWPEAGPGGRFAYDQMLGVGPFGLVLRERASELLTNRAAPWRPKTRAIDRAARGLAFILFLGATVGLAVMARRDLAARRLLALGGTGLALYGVAGLVAPLAYIPERYLTYLWVPYAVLAVPYVLWRLTERRGGVVFAGVMAALVLALGGRLAEQGLIRIEPTERQVLDVLAATPPDSVIAGWPDGVMDSVPYFANRQVLITREMHLPWREAYAAEMRRRMDALIAAWFAPDAHGLEALRGRYGVDYVVVDKAGLGQDERYFAPFDTEIAARRAALKGAQPYVAQPDPGRAVFENARYRILDLRGAGGG